MPKTQGHYWLAPNHVKPYRSTFICMSRRMLIEKGVLLPVGSGEFNHKCTFTAH